MDHSAPVPPLPPLSLDPTDPLMQNEDLIVSSPLDQLSPPPTDPPVPDITSQAPLEEPPTSNPKAFAAKSVIMALVMFGFGLAATVGYFRYFNDSTPPPPQETYGRLLGANIEATPSATIAPTPNLTPQPQELDESFPGTIVYIQDNQIVTRKADRSSPDLITEDNSPKNHLTAAPDGIQLAYTTSLNEPELRPNAVIIQVNRQDKEAVTLLESTEDTFELLNYSPSGRYLAVWANSGQVSLVVDTQEEDTTLRFSTEANTGISPIAWIPGADEVSFVLDGELFTANSQGKDLESLATNVIGLKIGPGNIDIPLAPIWSQNGKLVAFARKNGVYYLDLDSREESVVVTLEKELELDTIPYRPLAFTASGSHLIYLDTPNEQGQNVYAYSLEEKKIVPLAAFSSSALYNPFTNSIIGLVNTSPNRNLLSNYSLDTWEATTCTEFPFNYPLPPTEELLSPVGQALPGVIVDTDLMTLKLADPINCQHYDLVNAPTLASPLWLPN